MFLIFTKKVRFSEKSFLKVTFFLPLLLSFFPLFLPSFLPSFLIVAFFCSLLPHPILPADEKRMRNVSKPLEKTAVHLNLQKTIEERNLKCETSCKTKLLFLMPRYLKYEGKKTPVQK